MARATRPTVRSDPERTVEAALRPYVSSQLVDWLGTTPSSTHRSVLGTLLFADISGFTRLTERLTRLGDVGAEELSDALDATFGDLLAPAYAEGADLLKWGGDAVLLLFEGPDHAPRAGRAAWLMRERLRTVGRLSTSAGHAVLRMSQGLHSGLVHLFLVGDPTVHRELLVCGPAVSTVVAQEAVAGAGQIAVSPAAAGLLHPGLVGGALGDGVLLRRLPAVEDRVRLPHQQLHPDLAVGLPAALRQHLLDGVGAPEHRLVAVAFVAWSGSDRLLEREGPAAAALALDEVVRNVASAAGEHEVTFFETDIAQDGGKIMLVAGAPTSAGHLDERLLRACRQIVDRAGVLPLRIGVNRGHVFAGDFGPVVRRTYSVKGDAINLAARLVARARDGQIIATNPVLEHSATEFATTALEPFTVKGKSRPVYAAEVGAVVRERRLPTGELGPLVGRADETATLLKALEASRSGVGRVVEVVGEPGVGKSRLLTELGNRAGADARERGTTVLVAGCDEYAASTPYDVWGRLLRLVLDLGETASGEETAARLTSAVRQRAPHLESWLPLLGTVLGVEVPDTTETARLADELRKRRVEDVTVGLLRSVLTGPALLLVDDAQHLDVASADLTARLARELPQLPWLLVLGHHLSTGSPLPEGVVTERLDVVPLSGEESVQLLRQATDDRPLPASMLGALARRSGGNPLFLEALASAAAPGDAPDALPESVADLVTTQVDRLPVGDRQVLRYASVLGIGFETADLVRLVADDQDEPDAVTWARLAEFLLPDGPHRLRFRHGLMRDVAYDGLPYRTRRRLHARVGHELEAAGVDEPGRMSLHFLHAGRFDKAWHYALVAARRARTAYANQEAAELYQRALLADRRGGRRHAGAELGPVLEELGDTWLLIGVAEQAASAYLRARQSFPEPLDAARIVEKQARVDVRRRRLPQSLRRVTGALHQLDGLEGPAVDAVRSLLATRYAITRFGQGRFDDAVAWGERALADAERSGDLGSRAQAYATLDAMYAAAVIDPPQPYGELALDAYTELDDLPHQASCTNNLAVRAIDQNLWPEAFRTFDAAALIYQQIGDTLGEGTARFNQAHILVRQGRYDEADLLLDEALRSARSVADAELVALVLRERGRLACRRGEAAAGIALLLAARSELAAIDDAEEVPTTDLAVAEGTLLAGDPLGALAALGRLSDGVPEAEVRLLRAHALLAVEREGAAEAEFAAGLAAAEGNDQLRALHLLGLAYLSSVSSRARRMRAEARRLLKGLGVVATPYEPGRITGR